MIARHDGPDKADVWARLAADLPADAIQWRQQGRAKARDGKYFAAYVAYTDAQVVRDRLDSVVPGEWDLTLSELPVMIANGDGEVNDEPIAFKARLQILGVIREDVGTGRDYKNAATDAFKRAAVRFGIAHELYTDFEVIYVQVDGDGKYARPLEDPADVWARKQRSGGNGVGVKSAEAHSANAGTSTPSARPSAESAARQQPAPTSPAPSDVPEPSCPKCGGRLWDNRLGKRNPKAPDGKCRSRSCDGVVWKWGEPNKSSASRASRAPDDDMGEWEPPTDGPLPF